MNIRIPAIEVVAQVCLKGIRDKRGSAIASRSDVIAGLRKLFSPLGVEEREAEAAIRQAAALGLVAELADGTLRVP